MTLTRIRAGQISDIDYKQAVRVLELANVTLSGGTPSTVDGVSLNINDRILVAGQSTASQNGLYDVSIVGSGSNGTWVRTSDSNATGEINAGMIVMVTEGTEWADTSWKLITNNPITIGTTALTFLQNTGNSFSIINVVGSANVVANGVSSTVAFASGNNISITGNSAADIVTFSIPDSPSFFGNVTAGNLLTNGQLSATGTLTVANAAYLGGAAGAESLRVVPAANVGNYFQVTGGDRMVIEAVGNATDVAMSFNTQGSAGIAFSSDSGVSYQFYIGAQPGAINYLTVQGGATGYNAVLSAYTSQDNDAGISYITKGTGSHRFQTDSDGSSSDQFLVAHTASAVNYLQVAGGNTGNAVTLSAQGSDGNIGILITPKGTGNVNIDANLSVSGNIQEGNIRTTGLISTTGKIIGGNLSIIGNISTSGSGGNITGNNLIGNTVNWTSNGAVTVYQIYNAGTTSLDTIFI